MRVLAAVAAAALTACGTTVTAGGTGAAAPGGVQGSGGELGGPAAPEGLGAAPGPAAGVDDGVLAPAAGADPGSGTVPGSGGTGPGMPAPESVPASTATVAGRAADTRPIAVGIVYVNNDSGASSAGVNNGNSFTPRRVYEAMVQAYNARGGVGGRRIQPVYAELQSSSTNLSADIAAVCTRFTQDARVAVVLGGTGIYSEDFSSCLAKAGTPQIAADYALGDAESLRQAPYYFAAATLDMDARMTLLLGRLRTSGRLTPDDRLGVVVEGCSFNKRAYSRSVAPTAKRLGLTVASKAEGRCFESIGDLGGVTSDMQGAVLQFQTDRVDKVLFVSGSIESNYLLLFATAAESQGYRPGYALTSAAAPAVQEANTPRAQLAKAFGLGWLPAIDTTKVSTAPPAAKRCLTDLSRAGITPQSPVDRQYAYSACDTLGLYDAALRATGGQAGAAAVAAAIGGLRTSFAAAAVHGERTDFGSGRRTGPGQGRVFAWSAGCGCFEYSGSPVSLTDR